MKNWLLFFSSLSFISLLGQSPQIEWQITFGGSEDDVAYDVKQTMDGGYIVAGYTRSTDGDVNSHHGNNDAWIVKISPQGNLQWEKTFGTKNNDGAKSITQTHDGGYIITGWTESEISPEQEKFKRFQKDIWVVKISNSGELQWQKTFGESRNENGNFISQTSDGGYIVAGKTTTFSSNGLDEDACILKLDKEGNAVWQKTIGTQEFDAATAVVETADGFIVYGESDQPGNHVGENDCHISLWHSKLDNDGNLIWKKPLPLKDLCFSNSLIPTPDGGYLISGTSDEISGEVNCWIRNLDAFGNMKWEKNMGGSKMDFAYAANQTNDDGYIIAGASLSSDGDVQKNRGGYDFWIVKLAFVTKLNSLTNVTDIQIYPNPVTDVLYVEGIEPKTKLEVTNIHGDVILKSIADGQTNTIDVSDLPTGVYFLNSHKFLKY